VAEIGKKHPQIPIKYFFSSQYQLVFFLLFSSSSLIVILVFGYGIFGSSHIYFFGGKVIYHQNCFLGTFIRVLFCESVWEGKLGCVSSIGKQNEISDFNTLGS
jgi:hypothetical protein